KSEKAMDDIRDPFWDSIDLRHVFDNKMKGFIQSEKVLEELAGRVKNGAPTLRFNAPFNPTAVNWISHNLDGFENLQVNDSKGLVNTWPFVQEIVVYGTSLALL